MNKGKRYSDATRRYDRQRLHDAAEGLDVVKALPAAGFNETVDVAVCLGVDPRRADQMLRGTVSLPAGSGKEVRVAVFAAGEAAIAAREAGADHVGDEPRRGRAGSHHRDALACHAAPVSRRPLRTVSA